YTWTKISGPTTFNIVNANATQTQVTAIIEGSYLFELKVTDSSGLSDKDTVQIRVSNGSQTNRTEGIYQFELKVTDAGGLFAKDTIRINVIPFLTSTQTSSTCVIPGSTQ